MGVQRVSAYAVRYRYYKNLDVASHFMKDYVAQGFECELSHIPLTKEGCEWLLTFA